MLPEPIAEKPVIRLEIAINARRQPRIQLFMRVLLVGPL
jgi:hypothetical protein